MGSSSQLSFLSNFLTETIIGQTAKHQEETPITFARCRFWQIFSGSNNKIVSGRKSLWQREPHKQDYDRIGLLIQHSRRRLPGMFCKVCLLNWKKIHGIQLQFTVTDTCKMAHQNMQVKQDPWTCKLSAATLTFVVRLVTEDNYTYTESFRIDSLEKNCYSSKQIETWQIIELSENTTDSNKFQEKF
jgi:hypothetical protein